MKAETLNKTDDIDLWFEKPPIIKEANKPQKVSKKNPPFLEQSSWSIMYGVTKELLKRHGIALQIVGFWGLIVFMVWNTFA